jgi:hypothetical protein
MKITVYRYSSNNESTLGLLMIDGQFECYTLEDEHRTTKVWGETRVPAGVYNIKLRKEGGFHRRYGQHRDKNLREMHEGMLCVYNKPDWVVEKNGLKFQYILIHIGNTDDDTAGCLLVGSTANNNQLEDGRITQSTIAYKNMYPKVRDALLRGEEVLIEYIDADQS